MLRICTIKKGDRLDKDNYQSVSVQIMVSKMFHNW